MNDKPGVMLYFDILPALEHLTNSEKGILFQAILQYGKDGTPPELPKKLKMVWSFIVMRLDNDSERYKKTVISKKYAAYTRWERHHCQMPLSFVDWMKREGYEQYIRDEDYDAPA